MAKNEPMNAMQFQIEIHAPKQKSGKRCGKTKSFGNGLSS